MLTKMIKQISKQKKFFNNNISNKKQKQTKNKKIYKKFNNKMKKTNKKLYLIKMNLNIQKMIFQQQIITCKKYQNKMRLKKIINQQFQKQKFKIA